MHGIDRSMLLAIVGANPLKISTMNFRVTCCWLFASATCGTLMGCGGSGDSNVAPAPSPPPPSLAASPTCTGSEAFSAVADSTVVVGKAAGAVLAGCSGAIRNVQWSQTAGAPVELISAKTQAISFEPPSVGIYSFSVTFTDASGIAQIAALSVNAVAPSKAVTVLVRADQAVREGGSTSLRAWPFPDYAHTTWWEQTAGPRVTLDTTDQDRVLFVAPEVTRDTALRFRVHRVRGNVQVGTGEEDIDDVTVLVENYTQAPSDPNGTLPFVFSDLHVSRTHPYRASGPFAGALVRCTYDAALQFTGPAANLCPLSTLPFLHQTSAGGVPTADQVMDRLVVSHDWMGEVFEQFVRTQATPDMLRLLNGVTAIVIGAQVRPSFYYALTGAIYLDAENFWLTAAQRDVINEAPDFRSDFDRDLMYSGVWRYTDNNQNIFLPFPSISRLSRDIAYLLQETGWLMYHELAHASDFMPPAARASLNNSLSAWANIEPRYPAQLPSTLMTGTFPLQSAQMGGLAQVKFFGATANATQIAYTPDVVASFFAADRATDEYNYSNAREDIAMTFEEFMMVRNHAWRRDVAITDKITATTSSSNLIVRWGQRGRIGEAAIKPRARYAVEQLAPWVALTEVDNLAAPTAMRPGDSWAANLIVPAPPGGLAGPLSLRASLDVVSDRALLRRALAGVHGHGSHRTPHERWLNRTTR